MSNETAPLARTRIAHLDNLGDELRIRGFAVRLTVPRVGPPSLHVVNPQASALAENILAESSDDGWWYWWSWAERIARVEELSDAVRCVVRVLSVSGDNGG